MHIIFFLFLHRNVCCGYSLEGPLHTDVHAKWPPLSVLPGIWLAPYFQQNVYDCSDFSEFVCERPHFSDIPVYGYIFWSEIFLGCLFSGYSMTWLWYLSTISNKLVKKKTSKGSIWIGQHFGQSSIDHKWFLDLDQVPQNWASTLFALTKGIFFKNNNNNKTINKINQTLIYIMFRLGCSSS